MVLRYGVAACATADFTSAAVVVGNSDHSSAMAPVTNGVAALVPPDGYSGPTAPRLVTLSPGALTPRRPIVCPRFD